MKVIRIVLWITGLILAVIAPIQLYRSHRASGFIGPLLFLFLVLPPILIIGTACALKIKSKNRLIHYLSIVGLIVILLYYILLSLGLEMFISAHSVIDIQKYEKILNQWKEFAPDIVYHFPKSIPSDAQNVEFYFRPGILQSDSVIQLRYKTSPEEISKLYDRYSKLKTQSYYGRELIHFIPHQRDADIIELGKDFETLQFDENPDHIPEHAKEHGVIISKEKNEIIFWAEW